MTSVVSVGVRILVALPLLFIHLCWILTPGLTLGKAAPVALFAAALWNMPVALVILAVFAPLQGWVELWAGPAGHWPRLYEQLVVAVVVAGLARGLSWSTSRLAVPALVMVAIALTSAVVTMPTWLLMNGIAASFAAVWEPFLRGETWQPVEAAFLLIAGALLAIVTENTIRKEPRVSDWVLLGLIVGAGAASVGNLRRLLQLATRQDALNPAGIFDLLGMTRLNTQFDINAAGSMFVLLIVAGTALCYRKGWIRSVAALGIVTMGIGGLWLSGSRAALAAGLVAMVGALAVSALRTRPEHRRRAVVGVVAAMLVAAAAVAAYPATRNFAVSSSVESRLILYRTAVRMWRDAPVTGMGIGTFFTRSVDYGSAEIDKILVTGRLHENAHNYFLQVLAEMGVIGLASYLVLLATALWGGARAVWIAAGVLAFLATSLTGHPQLLSGAVLPFWLVFGALAASGTPPSGRLFRIQAWTGAVLVVLVMIAIPLRWDQQRDSALLEHRGLAVSMWQFTEDGVRYRIGDEHSVVFVPTGHTMVMPVRLGALSPSSAIVDVSVDGVLVNRLELRADEWTDLRLSIRNARRRFVELRLSGESGLTFWMGRADAKPLE